MVLLGRVGKDPRVTTFQDGGKVAQFTLATTERGYTSKDGRKVEDRTTWHNIVARRGIAGVVEKFVQKGTSLLIVGKYESRKYTDQQGNERIIYEVNVDEMELLGGTRQQEAKPVDDYDDLPPAFNL
jgi:single-strand DNA-binding protein